jgi:hypothetical protein
MEIITFIAITAILGCGLSLKAPVLFFFEFGFDRRPAVTAGVSFLFFRHRVGKTKKQAETQARHAKYSSPDKGRPAKKTGASKKQSILQLGLLWHEHQVIWQLLALFADCAERAIGFTDRYYIELNLSGGFRSPDITGQIYGLVQTGRAIPSPSLSLAYRPDFSSDRLQGTIAAGSVFKAYKLIILLILIIWRLPKIKLIKIYRKFKKGDTYV